MSIGQVLETTERRVSGAEVVDGDLEPRVVEGLQDLARALRVRHGGRFGDLDRRPDAGPRRLASTCAKSSSGNRADHSCRGDTLTPTSISSPASVPYPHLAAHLADHPVADGLDQSDLLGQRDELDRGGIRSPFSVTPRMSASTPGGTPVAQVDDRLVVQHPTLSLDRLPELRGEPQPEHRVLSVGRVHDRPARTDRLRSIHRHVGVAQERLARRSASRGNTLMPSDALMVKSTPVERERLPEELVDAPGALSTTCSAASLPAPRRGTARPGRSAAGGTRRRSDAPPGRLPGRAPSADRRAGRAAGRRPRDPGCRSRA